MFKRTAADLRKRSAWRELINPLPLQARRNQWLKRDLVERNEEILRRPYYTLKPMIMNSSSSSTAELQLEQPSSTYQNREGMQYQPSGAVRRDWILGPQLEEDSAEFDKLQLGPKLRPNFSESWDAMPTMLPSKYTTSS